jgi:ATPase
VESLAASASPLHALAERQVEYELGKHVDGPLEVSVDGGGRATVYVREREIGPLVGREGRRIAEIEEQLGIRIDGRPLEEAKGRAGGRGTKERTADVEIDGRSVVVAAGPNLSGRAVEVVVGGQAIFKGTVGRDGVIRFAKGSKQGKQIQEALEAGKGVTLRVQG